MGFSQPVSVTIHHILAAACNTQEKQRAMQNSDVYGDLQAREGVADCLNHLQL